MSALVETSQETPLNKQAEASSADKENELQSLPNHVEKVKAQTYCKESKDQSDEHKPSESGDNNASSTTAAETESAVDIKSEPVNDQIAEESESMKQSAAIKPPTPSKVRDLCKAMDVLLEPPKTAPVFLPSPKKAPAPKPKGRRRKKADNKDVASADKQEESKKTKKPVENNHLVTDYFPIRRSSRVPRSELKKMEQKKLEDAIMSNQTEGLVVQTFPMKGRGIVADKKFKKGDFVVEYSGDLIDLDTAKQRDKDYTGNKDVGCYMYYFNHRNKSYCIDATAESGKLGRLLNHSKTNPNCCTRIVPIGDRPYLIIVAAKDIEIGEELLYDYGDRNKETLAANPWLAY